MSCLKPSLPGMLCMAALCLALTTAPSFAQNIWVNEIHYNNIGTDQHEFIEIALENPSAYTLSDFTVSLYSGNTLSVYTSKTLNGFAGGSTSGNVALFYFAFPTDGIQNSTAGIAIDYQGHLISLISYDGTFTPTAGPANGVLSEVINVKESGTTDVGFSLQLAGNGDQYAEFYWTDPSAETPGNVNSHQTFTSAPTVTISASPASFDFGSVAFGKNAQPANYICIGANLTNDLIITPPPGFQVSLNPAFSSTIFSTTSPMIVTPIGGTIKAFQLYARFSPLSPNGMMSSGNITHTSSGASDRNVQVTGTEGSPNAWINEFHYNDVGVDANEFIEVIVKKATQYNLSDFSILLYDGTTGTVYDQETLDHFIAGQKFADYSIYALDFTNHGFFNIQNGPDGIALAYKGNIVVFISYQGNFLATDGPAAGNYSENLAPSESNSTPENSSIYLINALTPGSAYSDFTWSQSFGSNSMGLVNPLEVLPIVLKSFTAHIHGDIAELNWTTASEVNNQGFAIQRSVNGKEFNDIGFIKSDGNSETLKNYHFEDHEFSDIAYYRLKQIDLDEKITFSKVIIAEGAARRVHFFPNPAKPTSRLVVTVPEETDLIAIQLIDQRGVSLLSAHGSLDEVNAILKMQFLDDPMPGIYQLKLQYGNILEVIKITQL